MNKLLPLLVCLCTLLVVACSRDEPLPAQQDKRLQVVVTLFPLYDFARNIGGERAEVRLLLPPGVEPHSFDPQPDDILRINRSDVFAYTSPAMEPWAARVADSIDRSRVRIVDSSAGIPLRKAPENPHRDHGHNHDHDHTGDEDPHLWLDFANAARMVDNLAAAMASADPPNRESYLTNAARYREQLTDLDGRYRTLLAGCRHKLLLQAGHAAFGYLAARYGLDARAATAINPEAEPTPARIAGLVREIRSHRLSHLFSEELVAPRLAETIARETGATVLPLNAAHSVSREEFARGVTFLELMERNLGHLATGLECR